MSYSEVDFHAHRIEILHNKSRKDVLASNLYGLLQGVKNNELTIADLIKYTCMSAEQIEILLKQNEELIERVDEMIGKCEYCNTENVELREYDLDDGEKALGCIDEDRCGRQM